jgi:NAD(P)-dependent dehydrogenase (short-subunit alcohol dehydrogenase family)
MKIFKFIILFIFLYSLNGYAQEKMPNYEASKKEITAMMLQQATDWSKGNIEAFMEGYIKSDSLKFIGSSGLTYGWQQTLENYKKRYPTKDHTGTLTFNLLDFDQLANDVFLVIGEYHLKRTVGDANGIFSIILKRIHGVWKIIADHSS